MKNKIIIAKNQQSKIKYLPKIKIIFSLIMESKFFIHFIILLLLLLYNFFKILDLQEINNSSIMAIKCNYYYFYYFILNKYK